MTQVFIDSLSFLSLLTIMKENLRGKMGWFIKIVKFFVVPIYFVQDCRLDIKEVLATDRVPFFLVPLIDLL